MRIAIVINKEPLRWELSRRHATVRVRLCGEYVSDSAPLFFKVKEFDRTIPTALNPQWSYVDSLLRQHRKVSYSCDVSQGFWQAPREGRSHARTCRNQR